MAAAGGMVKGKDPAATVEAIEHAVADQMSQ